MPKDDKFVDILTDKGSDTDVWVRWLWEGDKAYIITRRDEHYVCPYCCGEGHYTVFDSGYGNMIVQPEHEETCVACDGTKEVEALYGVEQDGTETLLWPTSEQDALDRPSY